MPWTIRLSIASTRAIENLDKPNRQRLRKFLAGLAQENDPRRQGAPLHGNHRGLWRYRVGDHRLICEIRDRELVVLVVKIGHRGEIYR